MGQAPDRYGLCLCYRKPVQGSLNWTNVLALLASKPQSLKSTEVAQWFIRWVGHYSNQLVSETCMCCSASF